MSEEDFDIYGDESDEYMGSSEFESSGIGLDGDDEDGDEEEYYDYLDDKKAQLTQYTHATRYTKTGIDTHRMRYVTLNVEEIQSELENKVKELDDVLQLGFGICMVLLLKYDWNDHKLLDYYTVSNPNEFMIKMGLYTNNQVKWQGEGQTLIKEIADQDYLCEICYTGPENGQNMILFGLENCHHQYCIDCYKSYVVNLSNDGAILIKCPFSAPNCKMMMRIEELRELSDYWVKIDENDKKEKQLNLKKNTVVLMTEEEIMEKFQAESDNDSTFEDELNDNGEKGASGEEMDEGNLAVYTYHQEMLKKEREERTNRRNKTILTKYWFNVANQYSKKNFKSIKNCPIADCDCMVKLTGFDSDEVATIEEFTNRGLIPIVQCGNKHRFCYSCMEEDHAPCTCEVSKSWKKKCKDDSETAKWISSNTKDCPKCRAAIEKNGGCNHMTCHNCRWEFCWVCMGDWTQHFDNFNCNRFVELSEEDKKKQNETKSSLEKYLFYYTRFENQRTSYEKDKALLEKFEIKILDMQKQTNVSWIETTFYRDCIDTLLESRRVLMWSYGLLFYMKASQAKQLMESAQFSLSSMVERLSRLFEDTKVKNVLKNKNKFLNYRSTVLTAQSRFLDTSLDSLVSKSGTLVGV